MISEILVIKNSKTFSSKIIFFLFFIHKKFVLGKLHFWAKLVIVNFYCPTVVNLQLKNTLKQTNTKMHFQLLFPAKKSTIFIQKLNLILKKNKLLIWKDYSVTTLFDMIILLDFLIVKRKLWNKSVMKNTLARERNQHRSSTMCLQIFVKKSYMKIYVNQILFQFRLINPTTKISS